MDVEKIMAEAHRINNAYKKEQLEKRKKLRDEGKNKVKNDAICKECKMPMKNLPISGKHQDWENRDTHKKCYPAYLITLQQEKEIKKLIKERDEKKM